MNATRTIGFPIMREESNERRVFLPDFVEKLTVMGFEVYLENGYGTSINLNFDDYKKDNPKIHVVERKEAFQKEVVLILRSPHEQELEQLGKENCLISMLHYQTHPLRRILMKKRKIKAISLDSIVDDFNVRLVENMKAVAWNGLEAAFNEFEKKHHTLIKDDQTPWNIIVLGTGMVGKQAVDAATKFGRRDRNNKHMENNGPGALVVAAGRNITRNPAQMKSLLQTADIVVDATQRGDPSLPIIPNEWIQYLPQYAIIVDLSVDPYTVDVQPPVVKGIEGIPQGNLDQYIFEIDDPNWDATVPKKIPSVHRRKSITCYSWPGIHPESCMRHYGQQLLPLMKVLQKKNYADLSLEGPYFERALYRARLDIFLKYFEERRSRKASI